MPAHTLTADRSADVGDTWAAWILVTADDGTATAPDSVTVALTLPDGTGDTGTATAQDITGLYKITYDLAQAGRHAVVITVTDATYGDEVLTAGVQVRAATQGALPDLSAVWAYLGEDHSYTSEEVGNALAAETAAQARRCRVPVHYPDDLAEALKRRVARNLAARSVPVATFTSFEGGGTSSRVPYVDAEVQRLEAPYLKLPTA